MALYGFRSAHEPKARKPLNSLKNITGRSLRLEVTIDGSGRYICRLSEAIDADAAETMLSEGATRCLKHAGFGLLTVVGTTLPFPAILGPPDDLGLTPRRDV